MADLATLKLRLVVRWWMDCALWCVWAWVWLRAFIGRPMTDDQVSDYAELWAERLWRHCRVVVSG